MTVETRGAEPVAVPTEGDREPGEPGGSLPNIVLIVSDDQGPWALGANGNDEIVTPNLDRLAVGGARFEHYFCVSPVCSPARASLHSGLTPSQHGVHDHIRGGNSGVAGIGYLDEVETLSDLLYRAGYRCGLIGKWHLGASDRPQHSFEDWWALEGGMSSYRDAVFFRGVEEEICDEYVTDAIAEEAVRFLRAADERRRPFFLSVNFTAPHHPWLGQHPVELTELYRDCEFRSCPQEPWHPWGPTSLHPDMQRAVRDPRPNLIGYFAAVTGMDRAIGRVLEALEADGLEESTVVIFTSDNGFNCGHHGVWGKGNATFPQNMYEESVGVPMIVRVPGQRQVGLALEGLYSHYDILPTIAELVGVSPDDRHELPGKSFLGLLRSGSGPDGHETLVVYSEYGPTRMVRSEEWKYVKRYPYGPDELYHLSEDPHERYNLVDDRSRTSVVRDLRLVLEEFFARYAVPGKEGVIAAVTGAGQRGVMGAAGGGCEPFYPPATWALGRSDLRQLRDRDWDGGY